MKELLKSWTGEDGLEKLNQWIINHEKNLNTNTKKYSKEEALAVIEKCLDVNSKNTEEEIKILFDIKWWIENTTIYKNVEVTTDGRNYKFKIDGWGNGIGLDDWFSKKINEEKDLEKRNKLKTATVWKVDIAITDNETGGWIEFLEIGEKQWLN